MTRHKHICRFCKGSFCVAYTSDYGHLCANCRSRYITFQGNAVTKSELARYLKETRR